MPGTDEKSQESQPRGWLFWPARISLAALPIVGTIYVTHIPEYLGIAVYQEQYLGLVLMLMLVSTFLTVPARRDSARGKPRWYDVLFVLLSLVTGGYVFVYYPEIIITLGYSMAHRSVLGCIAILLVLEASRRLVGWPVVVIGMIFPIYAAYAYLLPGVLQTRMIPWGRVLAYLYLSPGSMLGIPLVVAGTIVFSFIFFGRVLFITGAGKFFTDMALALMGRYRGGPAKVAIVGSCLFGSISGSASANVAMTGIITIPLMKRIGYKPHIAGAVEAVASTGGLIMPPVMAATAFIMAEFLEIPYSKIALSAFIPALLYYLAVYVQVHLEAIKGGLRGLPPEELPHLGQVIKQGWIYIVPAGVLLWCIFVLFMSPEFSALYGVAAAALVASFRREIRRILWKQAFKILEDVGRGVLEVGIVCAVAGIVIGSLSLTGLGLSLSDLLVEVSGGNVLILLVLAAAGAIVLGMGMPITATYIMLVVLVAPALIQLGIEPLAAHLFIMYFGAMSFLTPPVAIAAYVAASIAKSDPMRTGFAGVRLGIVAYIVPFVFALSPSLILIGSLGHILLTTITAMIGVIIFSIAIEGFLFIPLGPVMRLCFGAGGLLLIAPNLKASIAGFIVTLFLMLIEMRKRHVSSKKAKGSPGMSNSIAMI